MTAAANVSECAQPVQLWVKNENLLQVYCQKEIKLIIYQNEVTKWLEDVICVEKG